MKKILLIEDNPAMRENTEEILSLSNYDVTTAENGKIGLEKAKEQKPDLIICDIMMPEMDGYGVLYALSKNPETASIPFIFLSAKADRPDIRKGMTMGADDYITKPFDDMELLEAIESRLRKTETFQKKYEHSKEGFNEFVQDAKNFEDLKKLQEDGEVRTFKKKASIFRDKQYPHYLYLVNSGKVKTFRATEDGREFISGIYTKGDFFGYQALLEDRPYAESAEALEDCELTLMRKEDFLRVVHSNRLVSMRFIKMLANDLVETEQKLLDMAYNSVRKRVAQALVMLAEKYKDNSNDGKSSFSFSREGLASIAGTATESAIRTLSEFKSDGLIDISSGTITVLNLEKLKRLRN